MLNYAFFNSDEIEGFKDSIINPNNQKTDLLTGGFFQDSEDILMQSSNSNEEVLFENYEFKDKFRESFVKSLLENKILLENVVSFYEEENQPFLEDIYPDYKSLENFTADIAEAIVEDFIEFNKLFGFVHHFDASAKDKNGGKFKEPLSMILGAEANKYILICIQIDVYELIWILDKKEGINYKDKSLYENQNL